MIRSLLLSLCLLLTLSSIAQDSNFNRAERLEKSLRLVDACKAYKLSYEKTNNVEALRRAAFI
jgi:hypothetical protein